MNGTESANSPAELLQAGMTSKRRLSIGLPASADASERRFPITPEAAALLVERGYVVKIEQGAAGAICYTDNRYMRCGANVTSREAALACDVVIHLSVLTEVDVRKMRRGALLMTMLNLPNVTPGVAAQLLDRNITVVALDLIEDDNGNLLFSDVLSEVDGRSAMVVASAMLTLLSSGKGILPGGVAGVVPCEVMIMGSGLAAQAAAKSAVGMGAMVRMFDNDVYGLRSVSNLFGSLVVASATHPHVVSQALRTADVVIVTTASRPYVVSADDVRVMKPGVVVIDVAHSPSKMFPSLPVVNLADVNLSGGTSGRTCFVNVGSVAPRTAAMAMSNLLVGIFADVMQSAEFTSVLRMHQGMRCATVVFAGRVVNAAFAERVRQRHIDINIFLSLY